MNRGDPFHALVRRFRFRWCIVFHGLQIYPLAYGDGRAYGCCPGCGQFRYDG
jgi:hypothetical protein